MSDHSEEVLPRILPTKNQASNAPGDQQSLHKEHIKALAKAVLDVAPIRLLIDAGKGSPRYRRVLNRAAPSWLKYRGVFASFDEARAFVPPGARVGYDHAEISSLYRSYADFILAGDYPVLFWLREALSDASRLFDFGGNLGISFYSFARYLEYPDDIDWTVCDLPAVVDAGREMAAERGEDRLSFTTRFEDAAGCEIFLASGSVMYVEQPLESLLRTLPRLPKHILINRCPIHDKRSCVTLQNIRWMTAPYHVFQRDAFLHDLEALGYTLIDEWKDATHSCWIPFYPEHSVAAYSGFYLQRTC